MTRRKKLGWGETPWDKLSRQELLREVQRMASALNSARSVLRLVQLNDESSPFWGHGTGGRALRKAFMALERYDAAGDENCYRAFFRYVDDLLFSPAEGVGWQICDLCKTMLGNGKGGILPKTCITPKCNRAPMRPITWADLEPAK